MATLWFLIAGALLIGMALSGSVLKRLPLTASMFYLAAGALLGPWGLGLITVDAVRAPTDPVLASDVQVEHEHDAEPVRFNLTAEAGLKYTTAFPFVLLGLAVAGLHELGNWGTRWVVVELAWAVPVGLGMGRCVEPASDGWSFTFGAGIVKRSA